MPRSSTKHLLSIRELRLPQEADLLFPFVRQLNPGIKKSSYNQSLKEMLPLGYRCIVAFDGKKPAGACGIWTLNRFWCGRFMEVDNVIVNDKARSKGIGKAMMDWVEKEAKKQKCKVLIADSYSHNTASHRFYLRERYIIKGFCFVKELD